MKAYKFTVAIHEDYGSLGFKPSWYPQGDPLGGMAVAHDILEHFPKDNGKAEGELLALGASYFIRGETGYFQRNGNINSAVAHLSSDLPMIWAYHTDRDRRNILRPCGLTRDAELMGTCREIVKHAMPEFREREQTPPNLLDRERIARWIAKGYKRAQARYRGIPSYALAYDIFKPIEDGAEKALKHAEAGMVLTVLVDVRHRQVRFGCDYPNEEGGDYA